MMVKLAKSSQIEGKNRSDSLASLDGNCLQKKNAWICYPHILVIRDRGVVSTGYSGDRELEGRMVEWHDPTERTTTYDI
jgi:hypothetical protein